MGVKDLWSILEPVKEHCPLKALGGQTLAVDLSIWMCEIQQLQGVVHKPYLRHVFFRVWNLLQLGVRPVFVVDGTPPEVKWETIQKRLGGGAGYSRGGHRGGRGGAPGAGSRKVSRSHFKRLSNECCEMLDSLGVPYIQSEGEAEAMCAFLNAHGLVDACITNDGDAFLYGARKVYRNFTLSNKDPHVESYNMDAIERDLGLNQERLVALGLLLGCDYVPKGVPGIGKEMAVKLMQEYHGHGILNRFRSWSTDSTLNQHRNNTKKSAHCSLCGHIGSQREHQRTGCKDCDSDKYCEPNTGRDCTCSWHWMQRGANGRACEIMVWRKAKDLSGFPNQQVINEFMVPKNKVPKMKFMWRRPKPFLFHEFATEKMEWEGTYPMEKIIPMMTLNDMRTLQENNMADTTDLIQPHSVVKSRVRHGVPCLEIQWFKLDHDDIMEEAYYTTIEEEELFTAAFPKMAADFMEMQSLKKKRAPAKKKVKDDGSTGDLEPVRKHSDNVDDLDLDLGMGGLSLMKKQTVAEEAKTIQNVPFSSEKENETVRKKGIHENQNIDQDTYVHKQKHCNKVVEIEVSSDEDSEQDEDCLLPLSQRLLLMSRKSVQKQTETKNIVSRERFDGVLPSVNDTESVNRKNRDSLKVENYHIPEKGKEAFGISDGEKTSETVKEVLENNQDTVTVERTTHGAEQDVEGEELNPNNCLSQDFCTENSETEILSQPAPRGKKSKKKKVPTATLR